jgi:hypothetical protein
MNRRSCVANRFDALEEMKAGDLDRMTRMVLEYTPPAAVKRASTPGQPVTHTEILQP